MIGRNGERRSGISAQAARHDDDDDFFKSLLLYIYIYQTSIITGHTSMSLSRPLKHERMN